MEKLLDAEEVGDILGIAPKTVHKLARSGLLQSVRVTGRDRRFTVNQVQEYIESNTTARTVDVKQLPRITCRHEGGRKSKSVGASGSDLLREEIKRLCQ